MSAMPRNKYSVVLRGAGSAGVLVAGYTTPTIAAAAMDGLAGDGLGGGAGGRVPGRGTEKRQARSDYRSNRWVRCRFAAVRSRRISLIRIRWPLLFDFSQSRISLSIRNEIRVLTGR